MTITVQLPSHLERRLSENAAREGQDTASYVRTLLEQVLDVPAEPAASAEIDEENAKAIALLRSWRRSEATEDPEIIRAAEEDLVELKRQLNANRMEAGERTVFP